ncbi:fasciclin domain-containing protein [Aquicoccus sp. G2-2]|uniref:fasciclin domain-containing protein n=1 Tax=Aquicoccus sp. G2-2 TaxID=3092120 RepID=UPI002ADF881B|nr:fasciclin domain-containing protein [Aquicoccus sp. G2-2]MEA1113570.1 fasciclin domain-containing protein [Aquicoccus sp. G2-2]
MKRFAIATALVASMAASGAYAANDTIENPMVGGAAMFATKTIVENAVNSADHTTLVAAVKAAGLVETLNTEGPFTVFAPTNEAFAKLPDGTVETLLKPENKATLTKILTCHVVGKDVMAGALGNMIKNDGGAHDIMTLGGCTIKAMMKDGMIVLEDENGNMAHVTVADVVQSNGVIHVIDAVLLPKM